MNIRVADLCGPICVDPADGERLLEQVVIALDRGDAVCLDFTDVYTLTSSFLNTAVGCLYGRFLAADLAVRLAYVGLDETDESILHLVQQNAIRYFAASPEQREQLTAAVGYPFSH